MLRALGAMRGLRGRGTYHPRVLHEEGVLMRVGVQLDASVTLVGCTRGTQHTTRYHLRHVGRWQRLELCARDARERLCVVVGCVNLAGRSGPAIMRNLPALRVSSGDRWACGSCSNVRRERRCQCGARSPLAIGLAIV